MLCSIYSIISGIHFLHSNFYKSLKAACRIALKMMFFNTQKGQYHIKLITHCYEAFKTVFAALMLTMIDVNQYCTDGAIQWNQHTPQILTMWLTWTRRLSVYSVSKDITDFGDIILEGDIKQKYPCTLLYFTISTRTLVDVALQTVAVKETGHKCDTKKLLDYIWPNE